MDNTERFEREGLNVSESILTFVRAIDGDTFDFFFFLPSKNFHGKDLWGKFWGGRKSFKQSYCLS